MSGWDDGFGWYRAPKKPPPEHGIKVKKTGATWWGQRWIEALERMSRGYAGRLGRGRTYARAGRTHDLVVTAGRVSAKVTGSRPTPYAVSMRIATLSDDAWAKAIDAMAAKAQFAAELLAGAMPKEIDDAFRAGGASLFPAQESDLSTGCTCPDWANPCKHVAATHYVLGEALDRDPFLLFELRGRTKAEVLDALRAARGGAREDTGASRARIATVTLEGLGPADYDAPRAPFPALHLSFEEPRVHAAVLRQLGAPPAWSDPSSPAELLAPHVRAAAERARRIALAEPVMQANDEPDAAPSEPPTTRARRKRTAAERSAAHEAASSAPPRKGARTKLSAGSEPAVPSSAPSRQRARTSASASSETPDASTAPSRERARDETSEPASTASTPSRNRARTNASASGKPAVASSAPSRKRARANAVASTEAVPGATTTTSAKAAQKTAKPRAKAKKPLS